MQVFEEPAEPPKRDKQVKIYVTLQERNRLKESADTLDMSVPDLIRDAINEYVSKRIRRKKS